MKKAYIQPSMKAYSIKINTILAGSERLTVSSTEGDLTSDGKKRGYSDEWDDEDYE